MLNKGMRLAYYLIEHVYKQNLIYCMRESSLKTNKPHTCIFSAKIGFSFFFLPPQILFIFGFTLESFILKSGAAFTLFLYFVIICLYCNECRLGTLCWT
jgi:hypothetical protein